jgi:hypothetical protein
MVHYHVHYPCWWLVIEDDSYKFRATDLSMARN